MRKTSLIPALAAVFLLLAGCALPAIFSAADTAEQSEAAVVYRVAADSAADGGRLIRSEPLSPPDADAQDIDALLAAFAAPSRGDALACALPDGVTVAGWTLENGVVTLALNDAYLDVSPMEQTAAAFCAALTLCQADGVEAVTVTAGGQTVFSRLMPEDALLTDTDTDPYVRQLRLYFPDADGRYLISEYHSLTLDEDTSPERYVVEELLRGPNSAELQSAIPRGTALRSCETANGVCTVDLSAEFYDNRPQTALGERLTLYSLVDSLTALSGVDSVLILVDGQPLDTYVYHPLAEPLTWYDEPIGPVSEPKGEFDADLYLPLPDLDAVTPLPFRIAETDYESRAEAVLTSLLSAAEPGYPAIFPGSGSVTGLTVQTTVCTVDLSESFFVSIPENARGTAVQSMAATICALPDISTVRFTVGGGEAVFDGVDYAGPWREFDEIIKR